MLKTLGARNVNYANRGMTLEADLGATNEFYLVNDKAIIYKKPTPITISKVNYPSRVEAVIKEGYFRTPSTTDYNGVYKGKFVTNQGKKMSFVVSENGEENSDINTEDTSFDEQDSSIDNEGDESVDEFLDEYEKFWKTYINYMKKLDQNNPTAMIEYAKLLQQYNSYNKKLAKIKGRMSIDQLNRINQMNLELMKEMEKIK